MKQDGTSGFAGDLPGSRLLPFVLSAIAGSVDVIGFLGFGGPFIAHMTGNLVVLAARSVAGEDASAAHLLSVPQFDMFPRDAMVGALGRYRYSRGF